MPDLQHATDPASMAPAQHQPLKNRLREHPVYRKLTTPARLRVFMQHHVVCVWDFMSLLKSLQRDLTCLEVPWRPVVDARSARFLNEIVLGEETDCLPTGEPISHFEWYCLAMKQVEADTKPIDRLLALLTDQHALPHALAHSGLPPAARTFGQSTFDLLEKPLAVRAAVFFHAREDLIPNMFVELVRELQQGGLACDLLVSYLQRHIDVDGDAHGPLAQQLLHQLFADQPDHQAQANQCVAQALSDRLALWNAIETLVDQI